MRFAVLFLFLTATLTYAKDEDVAFSRFSLSTYFSSRSMQFAPLDDGKEIRPATLETYEVSSGTYSSDIKYRVAGERDAHSLAELGLRARAYSGNVEKATMMTNFEFDILFDSKFEYFQSRLMGDMGIMFNPLPSLLIGPAVGAYYSYFGSSMLFTGSPGVSDGAGETNDTYIVRTPSSTTPYILTMGPHNLGAYAGLYADFTALSFIELSGAALISLIDIPLAGTSAMNSLYDKGTSLSTKAIQKWNDWKPFMIDLRATVHLSRLGIGFETPILVGYRAFGYPSLGLTEKGWYFGAVIVND